MFGLIFFLGMIVLYYIVYFMGEMKIRYVNIKLFFLRDIVWWRNIGLIRSYLIFVKEKISVLWWLLMFFLVKRIMLFVLKFISMWELFIVVYNILKLCWWVDLLNMKVINYFFIVRIFFMRKEKRFLVLFKKIFCMIWFWGDRLIG